VKAFEDLLPVIVGGCSCAQAEESAAGVDET